MSNNHEGKIKDVYEENLDDELRKISELVEEYNYISMDTEFPGIVFPLNQNSQYTTKNIDNLLLNPNYYQNSKSDKNILESNYRNIKQNVDNLKMIQIGMTMANEYGELPENISTWQFNFKFDLERDIYSTESINLLELAGIDFKKFNQKGIEIDSFGEMLTTSGLVLNENVKWITFHGSYDFSYLIKALSNQPLPTEESSFNEYLNLYFCNYYDVRQLLKNISWLKGSLSRISNDLDIKRIGQSHQAGSDSLITSKVFFKLLSNYGDQIDIYGDKNKLFGFAYKLIDDYDRYSTYPNNFPNYPGISQYLGVSIQNGLGMNSMNVGSLSTNGLNTMSQANTGLNNSKLASNKSISNPNMHNLIYFQNMNNLSNINSYNNFSTANMNNMGNINNMNFIYNSSNIPGFNNIYQPQVDPYFYGNFYNGGNTNGTVSGSFKQPNLGNNTLNNISANPNLKESKFISQS